MRNALADPFVLGISSGAAVGATAVILLGAIFVPAHGGLVERPRDPSAVDGRGTYLRKPAEER